jgi:hypothetical protein
MPKYRSPGDGMWYPVTKFTKMELEAQGLKTLGQPLPPVAEVSVSDAPIEGEDQIRSSGTEKQQGKLNKVTTARGVRGGKTTRARA